MANHDLHTTDYRNTYVERERVPARGATGSGIAFVVGGLVVAALVLFWLFTGTDGSVVDTAPPASDVSITVDETPAAPAADSAAPAADATAPAADSAAPAEQTAPAQPAD